MKTFKIILIILLFTVITASLAFIFVRYQEDLKLSAADPEDAALAKILLSRVKDMKDRNEPAGFWDKNGNLLDVTDATTINSKGEVNKVTKYEVFKDIYGNDVEVKLRKEIEKTIEGNTIEGWVIDRPFSMLTKFYSGEIKEIRTNSIVFIVDAESEFVEFNMHDYKLIDAKSYEKVFDFGNYDLRNSRGFMIPPDCIEIGFKNMSVISDFNKYLNKKISAQESITTSYKNSPQNTMLSFKEYY